MRTASLRCRRQETTRGQRELSHLQVYTELSVGRGAEVCVCERQHGSPRHYMRVRIPYSRLRLRSHTHSACTNIDKYKKCLSDISGL